MTSGLRLVKSKPTTGACYDSSNPRAAATMTIASDKLVKSNRCLAVVMDHATSAQKSDIPDWTSSLVCRLASGPGGEFRVRFYGGKNPPPIGSEILLQYAKVTRAGLPFNARIVTESVPVPKKHLDKPQPQCQSADALSKALEVFRKRDKTPAEAAFTAAAVDALSDQLAAKAVLDPVHGLDDLQSSGGHKLSPGESVRVRGETGSVWRVTMSATGHPYCSCPGWRFQKRPPADRFCKHTTAVAGA